MKQFLRKHKGVLFMAGAFVLAKILDIELPPYLFLLSLVDPFDSYSDGNLVGQGSWAQRDSEAYAMYDVQGTTVQAGTKAVAGVSSQKTTGALNFAKKDFTEQTNGSQIVYMRSSAAANNFWAQFRDGSEIMGWVAFRPANTIVTHRDTSLGSYSTNTWYKIEFEWRNSDGYTRARVNDGTWTAWETPYAAWTAVDSVEMGCHGDSVSGDFYFDSFSDPNAVSGPAKLKTFNGLAAAKIKTINGLAIAKVKTINNLP